MALSRTRCLAVLAFSASWAAVLAAAPPLPLKASNRWILDANDQRVKLKCINWGGHMEAGIPEGLHKQSVEYLADFVGKAGFNCVRLTYSIDMALDPGVLVSDSFANAAEPAGVTAEAMSGLYTMAVQKNPWLATATTLEAHGAVIDALWRHGVMTIIDNHVSRASWCCNLEDGNGWWDTGDFYMEANSRYFNTSEWLAGLDAMATWAKGRPGVIGMGVRNEIREL